MKIKLYDFKNLVRFLLISFAWLIVAEPVWAAAADPASMSDADGVFRVFLSNVSTSITNIQAPGSASGDFVNSLFIALVIVRLGWVLAQWSLGSADSEDIIYTILLILTVSALMGSYDFLTSAMHDWSTSFASSIQEGMLGTSDMFYAPAFLNDIIHSMRVEEGSFFDPIASTIALMTLSLASMLLSVGSFFVVAWATWGYALAKLIGWMLIPLLLLPATAQWFQKWFGFFMGFLFYEVIGRTNIAMVLMLLTAFFNLPLTSRPARVIEIDASALSDLSGLLSMLFISIIALFSTGKFAVAFGGAVDGFGSPHAGLKKMANKLATMGSK